ncbi:MAG: hypothetical protein J7M24_07325 [Candidatus Latescibacteria bacterium]|nr:hypothetical protein [Candidatus Latescibacterota bacterium]
MRTWLIVLSIPVCTALLPALPPVTADVTSGIDGEKLAIRVLPNPLRHGGDDPAGLENGKKTPDSSMPIMKPDESIDYTMKYIPIDPSIDYTIKIVPRPRPKPERFKPFWKKRSLPRFELPAPRQQMKRMMYLPLNIKTDTITGGGDSGSN